MKKLADLKIMPGYRKLIRYKYQLMEDYHITVEAFPDEMISTPFMSLSPSGDLHIKKGYCWDGCSGPTIDDPTNMRAGLVHDCLYQCMRTGQLDQAFRNYADRFFQEICLEDGMPRYRAWMYYYAVHKFAAGCAKPKTPVSNKTQKKH